MHPHQKVLTYGDLVKYWQELPKQYSIHKAKIVASFLQKNLRIKYK